MKFNTTQEEQIKSLKSKGWKVYKAKNCKAVAAVGTMKTAGGDKIVYKVWQGKASKPCAYFTARNMQEVEKSVTFYFTRQQEREEERKARNAARKQVKAADFFEVGDVVYNSWGYDQTNVDFYQVTKVLNKQIELRAIRQNSSDQMGGPSGGYCQPRRFEFVKDSKPFRKPIRVYSDSASIPFTHGSGSKWNGKALYCSSYH